MPTYTEGSGRFGFVKHDAEMGNVYFEWFKRKVERDRHFNFQKEIWKSDKNIILNKISR